MFKLARWPGAYYYVQGDDGPRSLVLAANTSFADFPRLGQPHGSRPANLPAQFSRPLGDPAGLLQRHRRPGGVCSALLVLERSAGDTSSADPALRGRACCPGPSLLSAGPAWCGHWWKVGG